MGTGCSPGRAYSAFVLILGDQHMSIYVLSLRSRSSLARQRRHVVSLRPGFSKYGVGANERTDHGRGHIIAP